MLSMRQHHSLLDCNTLAIDARAHRYCSVTSLGELREALDYARGEQLPVLVLGGGSNCVFSGDYPGLVVHMQNRGLVVDEVNGQPLLRVGAGENWDELVRKCLDDGLYGLEHLIAIPGSVGAAPVQNIGAYGVELSRCLHWVEGWDIDRGCLRRLSASDCKLAYRDSIFKGELRDRFVITEVALQLHRRAQTQAAYPVLRDYLLAAGESVDSVHPRVLAEAVAAIRASKLPDYQREPNAGSFFKNPLVSAEQAADLLHRWPELAHWPMADGRVKLAAAWLVDRCGWKGRRRGPVGVHPHQAIVLVNYQRGSGEQLLALADAIIDSVNERFGVCLEIEPRVY